MTTGSIPITAGSGTNLATHTISEDAATKHIYRVNLSTSAGAETGIAAAPLQIAEPLRTASAIVTETLVSVTTSNTSLLSSNASRKGGWVRNISDTDIFVSLSATATTSKPSRVGPGETFNLDSGTIYTGAVAAIHAGSGSKSVEVVEL